MSNYCRKFGMIAAWVRAFLLGLGAGNGCIITNGDYDFRTHEFMLFNYWN